MSCKIKFQVAYEGTDFCGWQRQNHGPKKGVQEILEVAFSKLLNEPISLFASGRTDTGVHALGQICHFTCQKSPEAFKKWDLAWAVRYYLPPTVSVRKVWIAPDDFHATISAENKTYRYFVYNHQRYHPIWGRYSAWVRHPIDISVLQEGSRFLLGEKDFKSFQSVGTEMPNTVRTIYKAQWTQSRGNLLCFEINGSGFLKHMVRNIVGTQLFLESKGQSPSQIVPILEAKDRKVAGPAADPQGLFLWRVYYPKDLDNKCRQI